MKVQYFGDVNDYRKFALLRLLATSLKIGVCWMMTTPDGRSDGNKRAFLRQPAKWRAYDAELFDALATVPGDPSMDDLQRIEREGLIPGATFFNDVTPSELSARNAFHLACLQALAGSELAFFDPDNGLQVRSSPKGQRNSAKFVFNDELADHYAAGRSVIVYQHYRRENRARFRQRMTARLIDRLPNVTVWAFHMEPVVFLLAARPEHRERAETTVRAAQERWPLAFVSAELCDLEPLAYAGEERGAPPKGRAHAPEAALASSLSSSSSLEDCDMEKPLDDCEVKLAGRWERVGAAEALELRGEPMRCPECHGPVRIHRESSNGARAHFEHMAAHPGCSVKRQTFSGKRWPHPDALS